MELFLQLVLGLAYKNEKLKYRLPLTFSNLCHLWKSLLLLYRISYNFACFFHYNSQTKFLMEQIKKGKLCICFSLKHPDRKPFKIKFWKFPVLETFWWFDFNLKHLKLSYGRIVQAEKLNFERD